MADGFAGVIGYVEGFRFIEGIGELSYEFDFRTESEFGVISGGG